MHRNLTDKFEEAIEELHCINEAIFSMGGSGDIMEVYEIIKDDEYLLDLFDKVAKERERGEDCYFDCFNTAYHKMERVERMLKEEKRMPQEILEMIYGR